MTGALLAHPRRLPLAAAGAGAVMACAVAGCTLARPPAPAGQPAPPPSRVAPTQVTATPSPSHAPTGQTAPSAGAVPTMRGGPARLARLLNTAETVLGEGTASPAAMASQALTVQLACLRIATHPGWASLVTAKVAPAQRAAATADIAATADLVALTPPQPRLPPWRVVPARDPAVLRSYYRAAQAATGVGWSYLAAINFVETDFGRVAGPSTAGAQGPMQFLPSTWASYGHGDIHRPRNAILAAARFLRAHGAAGDIASAVYAYNPSWRYVDAVLRYAHRLRADPHALISYYSRQVIYRLGGGFVLLRSGYGTDPAVRPIRLRL